LGWNSSSKPGLSVIGLSFNRLGIDQTARTLRENSSP
jgi:hypothetical protein